MAIRLDIEYMSSTYNYIDTAYGSSIEDRDGFVKVLAHRETREILGCHIIGTDAAILIQEAANAMRLGLPTDAIITHDLRAPGAARGGAAGLRPVALLI